MAKRRVFFDKTEVVVLVPGSKGFKNVNLIRNDIRSVVIEPCDEPILGLIPRESEQLRISTSKFEEPFVFPKIENKAYYEEYKEGFLKFAKENYIPVEDTTNEE